MIDIDFSSESEDGDAEESLSYIKKFLDIYPAISGYVLTIQLFLDIYPEDNNPSISGYLSRNWINIQK